MSTAEEFRRPAGVEGAFIERIAERLGEHAHATTIFATPVESDGVTVIPVARARLGFGGGAGRQKAGEEGTGGGGGLVVTPVGYIELKKGQSTFRPISTRRVIAPLLFFTAGALFLAARRRRLVVEED
jgi:uncharacterized spore protein YtfJ